MKYQYFISSRYRNRDIVLELTKKLRKKHKTVHNFMDTDPFHDMSTDPEETMKKFEATVNWRENHIVKHLFKKDMAALKNSKIIIVLLPGGKSTHIEAGVAYGLGKKLILIGEQKNAESLYLIFDKCFPDIDSFIKDLK